MNSKSANLQMMNKIATDIVVQKATEDKLKQSAKTAAREAVREAENDLDDSFDSAEFEIMEREKARMMEGARQKAAPHQVLKGSYEEKTEKEFFSLIEAKSERILAHFYHPEFEKCNLLHNALAKIAYDHPETLFIKINATESPFLVSKLALKVLPSMFFFEGGVVKDTMLGFEGFGSEKTFALKDLLHRLAKKKAIQLNEEEHFEINKKKKETKHVGGESDDD